jgi:hypothetical protein
MGISGIARPSTRRAYEIGFGYFLTRILRRLFPKKQSKMADLGAFLED